MNVSSASAAQLSQVHVKGQQKPPAAAVEAPKAAAAGTTVTISSAARAAMSEASETPAQTAQEARGNDHQAQRLLAKEAAAKAGQ